MGFDNCYYLKENPPKSPLVKGGLSKGSLRVPPFDKREGGISLRVQDKNKVTYSMRQLLFSQKPGAETGGSPPPELWLREKKYKKPLSISANSFYVINPVEPVFHGWAIRYALRPARQPAGHSARQNYE
jgi:hypothetical protein